MTTVLEGQTALTSIEELPLDVIHPAADNPRRDVGDVTELAQSMSDVGLLQPLVVTPREIGYLLVIGHRRYAAAILAGLQTVPAIVRELTEPQRIEAMVIENCQRTDLTAAEEARGYQALVDLELSQRAIAAAVGRTQSHISKRLALLELPPKVLKALDSDGITIAEATELLKLKDHPNRLGAAYEGRGQHYQGIAGTVDKQLAELELDEKRRAAEAKLKREGVRIVKFRSDGHYPDPPKGAIEIRKDGGYSELKLDPKEHAKEPCHAAAIHPRRFDVVYFCTDRKRHPKLRTGNEQSNDRVSSKGEKRKQHEKAMAIARRDRRAFVSGLLAKKLPNVRRNDDVVDAIVEMCFDRAEAESRKVACQLLALEPIIEKSPYAHGSDSKNYSKPLDQLAAKSPADRLKVALALAFATHERGLDNTWSSWHDRQKTWIKYLTDRGYEISPAEKIEVAGKRPGQ